MVAPWGGGGGGGVRKSHIVVSYSEECGFNFTKLLLESSIGQGDNLLLKLYLTGPHGGPIVGPQGQNCTGF